MRAWMLVAAILASGAASVARAAPPPPLEPLGFLLGEWVVVGAGQPGEAAGSATFSRALGDRVILRQSCAEYPAAAGRPASRHEDLMVIHADTSGAVHADYYDNEGHVIRYAVRVPAPGQAVFASEPAPGEPGFRLSYRLEGSGRLRGAFEIAPAGDPAAFRPYLQWESRRAGSPTR